WGSGTRGSLPHAEHGLRTGAESGVPRGGRRMTSRAIRYPRSAANACFLAAAIVAAAQLPAQEPVNDRPNPYRTIEGWAKLPDGRTWGSTSAVAIALDGVSVWVGERCGANSCVGSDLDPILLFDA